MLFTKRFDPADPNAPTASEFGSAMVGLENNGRVGQWFMVATLVLAPLAIYGVHKFFKK